MRSKVRGGEVAALGANAAMWDNRKMHAVMEDAFHYFLLKSYDSKLRRRYYTYTDGKITIFILFFKDVAVIPILIKFYCE